MNCTRGEGYGPRPDATWCPHCQEYTSHTSAGCPKCGVGGTAERKNDDLHHVIKVQRKKIDALSTALKICNECAHEFRTGDTVTALLASRIADVSQEALDGPQDGPDR